MKIGYIAIPRKNGSLVCGSGDYTHAIIASVNPFVLVSNDGDMIWFNLRSEEFTYLCSAHPLVVDICVQKYLDHLLAEIEEKDKQLLSLNLELQEADNQMSEMSNALSEASSLGGTI